MLPFSFGRYINTAMKVRALNHLTQTVGSLAVLRPMSSVFDLDENEAVQAAAAGLVIIVGAGDVTPTAAKYRKTKVVGNVETK